MQTKGNGDIALRNCLKETRKKQKISQHKLAEMVGVSRTTISNIETGKFILTLKLALVICNVLDKKIEDIFYLEHI